MPPYYDSLLAKVIAWGETRDESIARMKRALEEFTVEGIATTIPFHLSLLVDPRFVAGDFDIHYVTELFSEAVVV
jgi:acetyl-CoA carboxylase biotin carboxylase subunit